MADQLMDVLVGIYKDVDSAQTDFDGLVGLVKDKKVKIEGAIRVSKDADGNVTIADTGNHLGRKGAGWGGGVGVIVGLFAPALLPAVAVGAAAGAIAGKFAGHKVKSGFRARSARTSQTARRRSSSWPPTTSAFPSSKRCQAR